MKVKLYKNWWLLTIKGLLAIIFGLFLLIFPGTSLGAMMIYFGIIVLAGGLFLFAGAMSHKKHNKRWRNWLYESILDIVIGLVMIIYPKLSVNIFVIILAVWALTVGFTQLFNAMNTHKESKTRWMLLLNALIVIIFAIVLFINPFEGAKVLTYLVGIFAIIFGIFITLYSLNLRTLME